MIQSERSAARLALAGVILAAAVWRAFLLASGGVHFGADEAVVGLMARHINAGLPIPTFFYGQSYMGSLDALLVAFGFRVFGESVLAIRLVQSVLFLGLVGTTFTLVRRLGGDVRSASAAALWIGIPPAALALYSTISLGGYGETLLIGNLLLLVTVNLRERNRPLDWVVWGALAGLGWWTNNLIVAYALPCGLLLIRRVRPVALIAVPAFAVCSGPWWLYNLNHDWESLRFVLSGFTANSTPISRLSGLGIAGIPALFGVRQPWAQFYWPGLPLAVMVVTAGLGLILASALIALRRPGIERFLGIAAGTFTAIFVLSNFGFDPTGRYLLPLYVPVAGLLAARRLWPLMAILILASAGGTLHALTTHPTGLTASVDSVSDFANDHDQAVLDYLKAHDLRFVHATYWAAYRLTFLSRESIVLASTLPYHEAQLEYANDRYPPYTAQVEAAARVAFLTANHPALDALLIERFRVAGVANWQEARIGPYVVYYDLDRRITPGDLGFRR